MVIGFQGLEDQPIPNLPDEFVNEISERYIELYTLITGKEFQKADVSTIKARVEGNVRGYLDSLV